jgi:hypothetical protein
MTTPSFEPTDRERDQENSAFAAEISQGFGSFGIVPVDTAVASQSGTAQLRRTRRRRLDDPVGIMTLVDEDGVLRWRIGSGPAPRRPAGRRARRGAGSRGRIVEQFKFEDLPANQIGAKLRDLDGYLTRTQGLFHVPKAALEVLDRQRRGDASQKLTLDEEVQPPKQGRVLLLVHGTFSSCENLLTELASSDEGFDLLREVLNGPTYDQVLAFNHPTLSVSPILNAATLASRFRGSDPQVDVICHSRGGLVTRWWLEVVDHFQGEARGSVVFAGSPLAGTGLASPHQLKGALDVLTNLSRALSLAAKAGGILFPIAAPLGHAVGVLFSMFGKITSIAAKTPLLDAGVAMIPGLAGQSREGANGEILRLREAFTRRPAAERQERFLDRYWFLTSNFETEDAGWRFWRHFRKANLADAATDRVFEGENDLVVDSVSMTDLADGTRAAGGQTHGFGTSSLVHHCNYFQQEATVELLRRALRVDG